MGTSCTHTFFLSIKFEHGGVNISNRPDNKRKDAGLVNEEIRAFEVRVIADDGEQLGILRTKEALNMAYDKDLDLVLVSPTAKPPVAKFMDYNKFKYDQQRRAREAKKHQKTVTLKELRLSPKIDIGDFNTKLKNGRKFLSAGDKLKISIRFRGREMAYTNKGREVMLKYSKEVADLADVESNPKLDGRNMFMTLKPKKDQK